MYVLTPSKLAVSVIAPGFGSVDEAACDASVDGGHCADTLVLHRQYGRAALGAGDAAHPRTRATTADTLTSTADPHASFQP
jgi:hypothetical protein